MTPSIPIPLLLKSHFTMSLDITDLQQQLCAISWCHSGFFSIFFFLSPKAFWADINLARPVKSLPAVFHSHHFCSWGGTHWFMGVRYQSTQQMCFRLVTHIRSKCQQWHPLWHRIVTSATRSDFCAVLQARPSKEGWDVLPQWQHFKIYGQWCCRHLRSGEGTGCTQKWCWWISVMLEIISVMYGNYFPFPRLLGRITHAVEVKKMFPLSPSPETLRCFSSGRSKGRMIYCSLPLSLCLRQGT